MTKLSKTFCVYPWMNVNTNTTGKLKLCCNIVLDDHIKDSQGNDIVLGTQDWNSIWNGPYMNDVRSKMLAGEEVSDCNLCYEREKNGVHSSRQWANKAFLTEKLYEQIKSGIVNQPTSLELRLGNKCNLKCNSCWSISSSNIYLERKRMMEENNSIPSWLANQWRHEINLTEQENWDWFETSEFEEFIRSVAPTLERLYLTGGEPTLIARNNWVLETLLAAGNKDVYVSFTTNTTNFNQQFYELINQFNNSEVQCSIDGIGIANAYIRYPSNWTVVRNNWQKISTLPAKTKVKIYSVIQAFNVQNVVELVHWVLVQNQKRDIDFVPIFLEHPEQLNIAVWPQEVLNQTIEKLQGIVDQHPYNANVHGINKIISYMKTKVVNKTDNQQKLREFISVVDAHRTLKFQNVFPDLAKILGI